MIDFSPIESSELGLRIGRVNADTIDAAELLPHIVSGEFDLIRLKVPAAYEWVSLELEKLGMPFFFSGSIRRYKTKVFDRPEGQFLNPGVTFEEYDGSQDDLLLEMLRGTWGGYPIGYYRSPYLSDLVDRDREIRSVFLYYKKFNLNRDYPDNRMMFIEHNGKYVGFFALNTVGRQLESHIGGILEPYRKYGYFLDMLQYINDYAISCKLTHFAFGARNENDEVQKIFQKFGYLAYTNENVFHVAPLLSTGERLISGESIKLNTNGNTDPAEIINGIFARFPSKFKPARSSVNWQLTGHAGQGGEAVLNLTRPVDKPENDLLVLRVMQEGKTALIAYMHRHA